MEWKTYHSIFIFDNVLCRLNSKTLSTEETLISISVPHSPLLNPAYLIKPFAMTECYSANRKITVS